MLLACRDLFAEKNGAENGKCHTPEISFLSVFPAPLGETLSVEIKKSAQNDTKNIRIPDPVASYGKINWGK